ncbi:MAG: trehalose-phosphatase [Elusimicrobia bacterium]|nr:trehalose-phosphatase [Elusimicrobiota bacterium]
MADFVGGRLLVGLDFDGTLARIVDRPHLAALAAQTRRLLVRLSRRSDTKVAILSGRQLDDLKRRVAVSGIFYSGNHGLEIEGPDIRWTHPRAGGVDRSLWRGLKSDLAEFPGAFIEHKGLGAAVHYRAARRVSFRRLKERIQQRMAGLGERFRLLSGKKTFDLRPNLRWDKGHALETIRRALPGVWMAVFIGDDVTDEEAFRTIGPKALTVRIGRVKASSATYIIPHRRLVDSVLEKIAGRSGKEARH